MNEAFDCLINNYEKRTNIIYMDTTKILFIPFLLHYATVTDNDTTFDQIRLTSRSLKCI
jgi:hypothetical protein